MKQRAKASGKSRKRQRPDATRPKRRATARGGTHRASSAVGEQEKIAQLTRELNEAREQQAASFKVLLLIGRAAGNLQPAFMAMLESITGSCGAAFANLLLYDGSDFRVAAMHGASSEYVQHRYIGSILDVTPNNPLRRLIASKRVQHIPDIRKEQAYIGGEPAFTQLVNKAGARTLLNVPLLKDDELVGVIGVYRQEVRPFTDRQVELVQNFAAQAVIAIENARLLGELRHSVERQAATSEVLAIISRLRSELDAVFEATLANGARLCEASFGLLHLHENGVFQVAATHNMPPAYDELHEQRQMVRPDAGHPLGRVAATGQVLHILDIRTEADYREREESFVAFADLAGGRTALVVPMLRDKDLLGTIVIFRQEVRSFAEREIELLRSFAAQTVIAIENVRLMQELRERTAQVQQLKQQLELGATAAIDPAAAIRSDRTDAS